MAGGQESGWSFRLYSLADFKDEDGNKVRRDECAGKELSDGQLWRYPCAPTYGNVKGEEYGWRVRAEESPATAEPARGKTGTSGWGREYRNWDIT